MKLALLLFSTAVALQLQQLNGAQPTYAAKSDVIVGTLKGMIDAYNDKIKDEEKKMEETNKSMKDMAQSAVDQEQRDSIIDERIRLEQESEKKVDGFNEMIATLEGAIKKLSFSDDSESEAAGEVVAEQAKTKLMLLSKEQ